MAATVHKPIADAAQAAVNDIYKHNPAKGRQVLIDINNWWNKDPGTTAGVPNSNAIYGDLGDLLADDAKNGNKGTYTADVRAIQAYLAAPRSQIYVITTIGQSVNNGDATIAGIKSAYNSAVNSLNPIAGLFQKQIWIRVAEVALGIALLLVGLVKLTNVVPKLESVAGKVIP